MTIEERRKRREAIKAKYRGQETPTLVETLVLSNGCVLPTPDTDSGLDRIPPSGIFCHLPQEELLTGSLPEPGQKTPQTALKDPTGQESPTELVILKDADLANSTTTAAADNGDDEPSAADYDPTMDMQEDKLRQDQHQRRDEMSSGAYNETKVMDQDVLLANPSKSQAPNEGIAGSFDMFADNEDVDMSTEAQATGQRSDKETAEAVPVPQAKALDMNMLDNWDDPEGYYKVILGELLDSRYHVKSNLGTGMFSSVVRAIDQKTNSLVAIKIIRNNETM